MRQDKGWQICQQNTLGHSKHLLSTAQEKILHMYITRWSIPKWNESYFFATKYEEAVYSQSAKTRPGDDHSSDQEYFTSKFRLNLKKVGRTTRPFRYDLNQISYVCTVEVTNRFKGLNMINSVPEELWMEVHNTVQEMMIETIPKKKRLKKGKMVTWEALQIAEKRK